MRLTRGDGDQPFLAGQLVALPGGEYGTVVSVRSEYIAEDGWSFGVGEEEGYLHSAEVRPATAGELAPRIAARDAREAKRVAAAALEARFQGVRKGTGDRERRPRGDALMIPGRWTGGSGPRFFVIGPDRIWAGWWDGDPLDPGRGASIAHTPEAEAEIRLLIQQAGGGK